MKRMQERGKKGEKKSEREKERELEGIGRQLPLRVAAVE